MDTFDIRIRNELLEAERDGEEMYPGCFQLTSQSFEGVCAGRPVHFVGAIDCGECRIDCLDVPEFWMEIKPAAGTIKGRIPGAPRVPLTCTRISPQAVEISSPQVSRDSFRIVLTPPCASANAFFD